MAYRSQGFRELCAHCEEYALTHCARCTSPLCEEHQPARKARCPVCEDTYADALAVIQRPEHPARRWTHVVAGSGAGVGIAFALAAYGLHFYNGAIEDAFILAGMLSMLFVPLTYGVYSVAPGRFGRRALRKRARERALRRRFLKERLRAPLLAATNSADDLKTEDSLQRPDLNQSNAHLVEFVKGETRAELDSR